MVARETLVTLTDTEMTELAALIATLNLTYEKVDVFPGLGTEQINLGGKTGYNNGVNPVLSNLSFIRSAPRYMETRGQVWRHVEPSNKICTGCKRTFGDMFGYTAEWGMQVAVPNYEIVAIMPHGGKRNARRDDGFYFCFDCATNAQNMRNALPASMSEYMRDGDDATPDVFDFVAVAVTEDRLHGTRTCLRGCELRLLHGGLFGGGNDGGFYEMIGGRLLYWMARNQREQAAVDAMLARVAKAAARKEQAAAKAAAKANVAQTDKVASAVKKASKATKTK